MDLKVNESLYSVYPKRNQHLSVKLKPQVLEMMVKTMPKDAEIRLLNVENEYRDRIPLNVGRYHIELIRDGYVAKRVWVELSDKQQEFQFEMTQILYPLVVEVLPKNAEIKLLDTDIEYRSGVLLPPGKYRLEVTKRGI